MRIMLLLTFTMLTGSPFHCFAMQSFFHVIDKNYVDPINYITEAKSSELCEAILYKGPANPLHKEFELDQEWLSKIHQAFEREQKLLHIVEDAICEKDSHGPIERIIRAAPAGLYSKNCLSAMHGYLHTKIRINEEIAAKLKVAQEIKSIISPDDNSKTIVQMVSNQSEAKSLQETTISTYDLSPSALEQLILESNPTWPTKFANYIRKTITNPMGYLTDSKAATVSAAIQFFHPQHPEKKDFNRSLPLHRALIHHAFEREIRFLNCLENALTTNKHDVILVLHQKTSKGYISNIAQTIMEKYLQYASIRNERDTIARQLNAKNALNEQNSKNNATKNLNDNCNCNPFKKLKDCPECLAKIIPFQDKATPAIPPKPECSCTPAKSIKDCPECLSKLAQQQPHK